MGTLLQLMKALGPVRLGIVGAVFIGFAGFLTYFSIRNNGNLGEMTLLYGDLDPAEGGRIITRLDSLGIPSQVKSQGTEIYVPHDQVGRTRMILAEGGLPSGGSIGYEIFDRGDTLGMSSFTQDINHLRALEGELSRSIKTIGSVMTARVHLVLPRRELFSRDRQEPRASVVLKMRGAKRLSNSQVEAIGHLVASAVPGLSIDKISIIDNKGSLLAKGVEEKQGAAAGGMSPTTMDEMKVALESRLSQTVEELLEKSIGFGKVRAEVSAEMDFDHYTENSEIYDPNGQVVRSTQTAQETNSSADGNQQTVTVENNLPGGTGAGGGGPSSQSNRNEETINYEISKTIKTHIREGGEIKRLSVAVAVDGIYTQENGKSTYKPRSADEIAQLTKLVRSAVGYQQQRGDVVEVVNVKFVNELEDMKDDRISILGLYREDLMHLAELGVIVIIVLLVIMMVIRPLMSRLLEIRREESAAASARAAAELAATMPTAGGGAEAGGTSAGVEKSEEENDELTAMLSLDRVDGRVKASSLKKINEIIEKHPEEALATIRSWMSQTGTASY